MKGNLVVHRLRGPRSLYKDVGGVCGVKEGREGWKEEMQKQKLWNKNSFE